MTNIEETHPSLKGSYRHTMSSTGQQGSMIKIHSDNIQEHTVDKQVLRDVLQKVPEYWKELGL